MRVHSVLFSGGLNTGYNHARYRADLKRLSSALLSLAGSDLSRTSILLAGGGDTIRTSDGVVRSQVASKQNLIDSLKSLESTIEEDDLFFFVSSNHGGLVGSGRPRGKLWCWNEEYITDSELAEACAVIPQCAQCYVMGQCNSGAFIGELAESNRVVMTACAWNAVSYPSSAMGNQFDEFLLRVAQAFEVRCESLEAVFEYAERHDREDEVPEYSDPGRTGRLSLVYG